MADDTNNLIEKPVKFREKFNNSIVIIVAVIFACGLFLDIILDRFVFSKEAQDISFDTETVEKEIPDNIPVKGHGTIEFNEKLEEKVKAIENGNDKIKAQHGIAETNPQILDRLRNRVSSLVDSSVETVEDEFKNAERRRALEARKVKFNLKQQNNKPSGEIQKRPYASQTADFGEQFNKLKKMSAGGPKTSESSPFGNQSLAMVNSGINNGQSANFVGQPASEGKLPGQKLISMATVIDAVLDQDVVSDYIGSVRYRIVKDVYDITDSYIMIPKGCKGIGKSLHISNVNEPIQARMGLTVNWAILPDGKRISFEHSNVLDRAGIHAIKDKVNRHFLAQFLGVCAYVALAGESSYEGSGANSDQSYAGEVGSALREQLGNLASRYLSLVPTITLRAGTPIKIFLEDDIYAYPYESVYEKFSRANR